MSVWTTAAVAAPMAGPLVARFIAADLPRRAIRVGMAIAAAAAILPIVGDLDPLARLFASIISILGALCTIFSAGAFSAEWAVEDAPWSIRPAYFLLLGAFWSSMVLVAVAQDLAVLWLGIASTTFATAFLVGFAGDATALEAAWKYLMLCGVGIVVAFIGIIIIGDGALAAGAAPVVAVSWSALAAAHLPAAAVKLGCALAVAGFATKAGLAPMHAWLPDAHSKAPAPVSALLSGVLVSCALYGIMRVYEIAAGQGIVGPLQELLLTFGALSTLVAGLLMLAQRDLKRLLAYSTIEHVGIVALALGFGNALGLVAAILHVVNHAFAKAIAFFAAGAIQHEHGTTRIAALRGLWSSAGGKFFVSAATALSGLPPFGLFASEILMIIAGVEARRWLALACGLVGIAFAVAALARTTIDIESGPAPTLVRVRLSRFGVAAGVVALVGLAAASVLPWTAAAAALHDIASIVAGAGSGPR